MGEVRALPGFAVPAGPQPDADVIEFVEAVLARAKAGEVVAVAFIEVLRDATVATGHVNKAHYHHLIAGAARLLNRLANDSDEIVSSKPA